jgi:RNA polymerase sigma-70 factor (ECF subfamily)
MAVEAAKQEEFVRWYLASRNSLIGAAFLHVGNMEDALDLTQETYARAWQHWDVVSVHPNRDAWNRVVLHNLAVSRWRHRALENTLAPSRTVVHEPLDAQDLDLARLVARLPANQRRAFVLHVVFDLTIDDVAHEMKAPSGTVSSWIHRARTALASQIKPDTRPMTRK